MNKPTFKSLLAGSALLAMLAACGGSDDWVEPVADTEVPTSATVSPQAFSSYAGSLAADDRAEPLGIDKVVPPTSETTEPADI